MDKMKVSFRILKILGTIGLLIIITPVLLLALYFLYWKITENKRFISHLPPEIKISRVIAKESRGGMCGIAAFEMMESTTQNIKNMGLKFFGGHDYPEWKEFPYRDHDNKATGYDFSCASEFVNLYGAKIDYARKNPGSYYADRGDNEIWVFPAQSMVVYTYFD